MWPTVEIRKKDDATSGRPVQVRFAVCAWERATQSERAFPELLSFAASRIGRPDGPRLRSTFQHRLGRAATAGPSHKRDPLSVRRPARARVTRSRRREINDWRRLVCVDADE